MKIALVTSSRNGYAVEILKKLNNNGFTVCCIVNIPKKRSKKRILKKVYKIGIGGMLIGLSLRKYYKLNFNDIIFTCRDLKIPYFEIKNFITSKIIKNKLEKFDLGISLGNGYIPERFFNIYRLGMINIHHEVLPDYPGASSVIWPIHDEKLYTGYTIHQINKKIDMGKIIYTDKYPIEFKENLFKTVKFNYKKSVLKSISGVVELLNNFSSYYSKSTFNTATKSYTTPTLSEFLKICRNHKKLKTIEKSA